MQPVAEHQVAPAVGFHRFSYRYPDSSQWVLQEIDLRIMPGEFVAVIGPNGAGKSTLCKCLNGVIPHFEGGTIKGRVRVHDMDTRSHQVAELARHVGLVLEDPDAQLFAGRVLDEAAFGGENLGMEPATIRSSVARALRSVGLRGFEDRVPSTLSGGQKQRLTIASLLAMTPRVLVFDEATSQLDAEGSRHLMELVCRLKLRYKLTVIVATHDMALASAYADRVIALDAGRLVAFDTPERVFSGPDPARFFRSAEGSASPQTVTVAADPLIDRCRIDIAALRCEYPGTVAVDEVSTTFAPGEFAGIVGRNGSGKTTLFKAIVGLLVPAAGDVLVAGRPVRSLDPSELVRRVGYVQQNPDHQLFADTVWKEVAFGPSNLRLDRADIEGRVRRSLEIVGLLDQAQEHPLALGRSDRSLVALASVLALDSAIILLDEPTRGHDIEGSRRVMEIACSLRDAGRTVIAIGHDLGLLCEYAERLIVMDAGKIVADGPTGEITDARTDVLEAAGVRTRHRAPYELVVGAFADDMYDEEQICG